MNQRGGYVSRGRSQQSKQHGGSVRKRNPVDGYITKCITCKSILHWAKDCPDWEKAEIPPDNEKTVCITLFNEEIEHCYIECFISETFGNAILDAGCIKTVCGKVWLNCYLEMLDEKCQSQ